MHWPLHFQYWADKIMNYGLVISRFTSDFLTHVILSYYHQVKAKHHINKELTAHMLY